MKKLILMSILIATFAIPMFVASRKVTPKRAIVVIQKRFFWFCVLYVLAVCYVVPRL